MTRVLYNESVLEAIIAFIASTFSITYLTNPFSRLTIIRLPYRIRLKHLAHEKIDENDKIKVHTSLLWQAFAYYQCGLYILAIRYLGQASSKSITYKEIIKDIHTLRFNPEKLLLISGDHFNGLFVRNLGVFYYPMLDGNVYTTDKDWRDRQEVYSQTVAYALGSFAKQPRLTTTIVPTGIYSATNINFYSYPSDSLYGILYALAVLSGIESAGADLYKKSKRKVDTVAAARELIEKYRPLLAELYDQYTCKVYDGDTGLIRTDIHLSGAKDITKRQSAFYDNVIYWKTTELAHKLGVITSDDDTLSSMKKRIISKFWLEDEGYFVEDLSDEAQKQKLYSSDWLIVLTTGFLDIASVKERSYFVRSIEYIQQKGIARPFAIKYQNETRAHRQFLPVRLAVASYGGDSIWSFWGMEYIKVNLLLAKYAEDTKYLEEADYHIDKYKQNLVKFKGFPEVYDSEGKMLQTLLYKSIRMTGWVIGFEQVLKMREVLFNNHK